MSNSSEIIANGRSFGLRWSGDAGPIWVVFPGLRYRLHFPAIARVQQIGMASGAQICGVETDYDQDPRLADLAQDDAVALIRDDTRAILDRLPDPSVLLGKSVGCVSLMEADIAPTRYIWMTPNLTAEPLMEAIQNRAARSFIVAGSDDPITPAALLQKSGADHVSLPGMDHALITGDDAKDAPILDRMDAALQSWL